MSGRTQYATFAVGENFLGIEVLDVQEVLCGQRLTRVPLAPEVVAGLINLRGQIVPALEIRQLLHLAPRDRSLDPLSVVVRAEHGAVSLQVDEIGDVIELDGAALEPPPHSVDPGLRALLKGVQKMEGRLLLVLDTNRAVDVGG